MGRVSTCTLSDFYFRCCPNKFRMQDQVMSSLYNESMWKSAFVPDESLFVQTLWRLWSRVCKRLAIRNLVEICSDAWRSFGELKTLLKQTWVIPNKWWHHTSIGGLVRVDCKSSFPFSFFSLRHNPTFPFPNHQV